MYHYDEGMVDKISLELDFYKKTLGEFGRSVAIRNHDKMPPALWWVNFGGDAPNLQKMAIRVLSQTCSVSRCERNWSVFEHIHTAKRNRLEHKRLNDLVYVQYNLHLRERLSRKKLTTDPISFENMDLFDEWVEESIIENPLDLDEWLSEEFASMVILDGGGEGDVTPP